MLKRCGKFKRVTFFSSERYFHKSANIQHRVLFFGTDNMSMPSLKAIASRTTLATKLEVVCPEDRVLRVRGKKKLEIAATKQYCVKHGIRYHEIPSKIDKAKQKKAWASLRERVMEGNFDLGVVISFGYFLPSSLLKLFSKGAINVHPSLLPKYRGAAPIEHALLNNDEVSGVSIIEVDPSRFDAGHILSQSEHIIDPSPNFNASELLRDLSHIGARDVVDVMENLEIRRSKAVHQDENHVSRAPKVSSSMGLIDWSCMSGEEIFGRFRALSSRTGVYTHIDRNGEKRRVMLRHISLPRHYEKETSVNMIAPSMENASPGMAVYDKLNKVVWIRCVDDDDWVVCGELQVERKKSLKALDFANGFQFMKRGTSILFI